MPREAEKAGRSVLVDAVMSILAVVSVLAVMAGSAADALGAGWRARAYFSAVALLFDVLFAYEFVAVTLSGRRVGPRNPGWWLMGLSSIPPLLLLSGPFAFGCLSADFMAASVRGYGVAEGYAGAFATVAVLRLARVTRLSGSWSHPSDRPASRPAATAAAIGMAVILVGSAAADALVLPGHAREAAARRDAVVRAWDAARAGGMTASPAPDPELLALRVDGTTVIPAPAGLYPADYAAHAVGGVEAWFSTSGLRRTRGLAETVCALAALAAALAYALSDRRGSRDAGPVAAIPADSRGRSTDDASDPEPATPRRRAARRRPGAGEPTNDEELAGILGKS